MDTAGSARSRTFFDLPKLVVYPNASTGSDTAFCKKGNFYDYDYVVITLKPGFLPTLELEPKPTLHFNSIVETAKISGLEPFDYITTLFIPK